MKTNKFVLGLIGSVAFACTAHAAGTPTVEISSVQQQYPWTNTVDITYNVGGVDAGSSEYFVIFEAKKANGSLLGTVTNDLNKSGVATTTWSPAFNLQETGCTLTPRVYRGEREAYMIVNLETWEVTYETMATQEASNAKYNTDEYKTKKLVLRKIPAGTYWIGGPENASTNIDRAPNSYHQTKMPKPYYFAIFELT